MIKRAICFVAALAILFVMGAYHNIQKSRSVLVIFDTDIAPDYDDVGALAMLHAFADNGEAKVLAVMSSNAFETTVPAISVINAYFRRSQVPIGVLKATAPSYDCPRKWAEAIIAKYPHHIKSNSEAKDAVKLYRKVLASQPDTSVTIITVGFFTNLSNLLNSPPDEYSTFKGIDLVKKKVKRLVSMAGKIDSNGTGGYEANILADIPAAQKVFAEWPTAIILSGHQIGAEIFTGAKLISNSSIQHSPVKDAYAISLAYDGSDIGRYSWDQTAVLVAIKGIKPYFNFRKLDLRVKDDGRDTVVTGKRITYLMKKQKPLEVARVLEDLMMHLPNKH